MINFRKYPFGQKIRHHVTATYYIPLRELPKLPDGYPPISEITDCSQYFLNQRNPNILDIGCGKGKFLLQYALDHPTDNILGIELRTEAVEWINKIIIGEQIDNAYVLWYSIVNDLPFVADNSIDKIFYLFPDPWPKNKHLKRRAFTLDFLEMCYRKLRSNGTLNIATDCDYVNDYHTKLLDKFGKFDYRLLPNRDEWTYPITNKERFCLEKHIDIYRLICQKR